MLDEENGFLLASNSGGSVPRHLDNEAGFTSDLTADSCSEKKSSSVLLKRAEQTGKKTDTMCGEAMGMITAVKDLVALAAASNSRATDKMTPKTKAFEDYEKVNKRFKSLQDDDCFSPVTKQNLLEKLNDEKKQLIRVFTGTDEPAEQHIDNDCSDNCDDVDACDDSEN
jgi:hypothetical protein